MKATFIVTVEASPSRITFHLQTQTNGVREIVYNDGSAYTRLEPHVQNALRTALRSVQKKETANESTAAR